MDQEINEAKKAIRDKLEAVEVDGPIYQVMSQYWESLDDFYLSLDGIGDQYDQVASYAKDPKAKKAAENVSRKLAVVVSSLKTLLKKSMGELNDTEAVFVNKYGDPVEYVDSLERK